MKALKLFIVIIMVGSIAFSATAQQVVKAPVQKTETLKVSGACGMCKDRIEKAVREIGATTAQWDAKTQTLTVSFDPAKVTTDSMAKKIASVGHDTEKYKAPDEVYAKLPGCCHYDRSK